MEKIIATNRKATYDYFILEKYEAGIVLKGTEVKSIRQGKVNLRDSFARIIKGEIFLMNMHISPYTHGNVFNHDPLRDRKLLMHKKEIARLAGKVVQKGLALVPLSLYFKDGRVKVELALVKGKKLYDKREDIKKRDLQRMEKRYKIDM